jgi:hypothetical protein
MPREYNFSKPTNNPLDPYESLPVSHVLILREEMTDDDLSATFFKTGKFSIGHYRLDIPEHKAYPHLNEYLDSAYSWLCQNCVGHFDWQETGNTQSATHINGEEESVSRFSIIITFIKESDAIKFAEACNSHNTFKKVTGDFTNQETPFLNPETITEKFIRHTKALLLASTNANKKPALALPAPEILRIK